MNLFYSARIENNTAFLDEEESSHCIRVMRMKKGDGIFLTDGNGNFYEGVIEDANPKNTVVTISGTKKEEQTKNYTLHIAIAPTKNNDRFEWFLEKAAEIGIDQVSPVICQRSERRELKTERMKKVLLSAMKQSLKAYLPLLQEPVSFGKFISAPHIEKNKFICTMDAAIHLGKNLAKGESCLVMIGPEGDFTEAELSAAKENNFVPVTLGTSRLRTETAGVVACSIVSLLNT
jgi:16S rRNA (uracil1498-N3)-methyltransferase